MTETVKVEVIDIDSLSSDEDEDDDDNNNNSNNGDEQKTNNLADNNGAREDFSDNSRSLVTLTLPAPNKILERQRKSLDELFCTYATCHNKLLKSVPQMSPLQRRKWQKHMSAKQKPIVIGGPEEFAEDDREEFNFEDEEDEHFNDLFNRKMQRPSAYTARRAPKRKYRKKKKKSYLKKREPYSRNFNSTSSGPTASSSSYSSARATTDRKPSKSFLAASLSRFIKKEKS